MKLFVLTAIIAAVASSPLLEEQKWPWQLGKVYNYDVNTYTWNKFEQGKSVGFAFKAQFLINVKAPGYLLAKLVNPSYASVKAYIPDIKDLPSDLKYEPMQNVGEIFEIFVDGGRVVSINFPSSLSLAHENLLKALISGLQVDVSTFGHIHEYPNSFDSETFQGLFKKSESDITGECETLYSVSPVSAEWRRELPEFTSIVDPIEIVKSKDYSTCQKRVSYQFGVPEGAVWKGIAYEEDEKQFIKHTSEARLLVGKQGTIYKSDVFSSVYASPLITGKQKAEVYSYVKFYLNSVEQYNGAEWQKPKELRSVKSLLYTVDAHTLGLFTYAGEQNIAKAQKILQDITPLLQNPNNLPKGEFLAQFNILVHILANMDTKQLNQLTSSVEIAKNSKNVAKTGMWIIYRDALAQSGTPEAFEQIKSWVLTKQIEGEEAGEVITSIGVTLDNPSKKILVDFFNFAISPEVVGQKHVNNSALLAVSKLFRFSEEDQFIVETMIPYFSKELKQAIENGDTSKAQVYVSVLGNLAHPAILKVFAPYLEGKVTVTKYFRTLIVANLKTLANLKNDNVRAVLFSIIRNTAEPYEVRVAAALNIFMAYPTSEMMQVLAHMTNDDPSTQVRAVLQNGINFSAGLKDPRFAELAKTAKSVLGIVAKEKFGYRYSTDSIIDGYTSDDEFSFFRELSYIGSENTILPKYQRSALRFKGTGYTEESYVTVSVSDVQNMIDTVANMILEKNKEEPNFKFTAKQIIELLNIKRAPRQPLEGTIFIDNLNQQKLITFNENELLVFVRDIIKNMDQLISGIDFQYTKILTLNQVNVAFPLVTGVPFLFEYTEPAVFIVKTLSKIKADLPNKSGSLENNIDVTYARNLDGFVGFIDTLGDLYAGTGIINKLQMYVPVKINTSFESKELKLLFEPLYPEKDSNIFHLSVWPYTGVQKRDSIEYDIEYIERPAKTVSTDTKFGYETGSIYQLSGYSYSTDYKNPEEFYDTDLLTSVENFLYQKDVALTKFNLKYLATESTAKSLALSLSLDSLHNQKNEGKFGPATLTKNVEPNSAARQEELAKKASAGIESAEVQIFDISAVFNGPKKVDYVLTLAYAYSFVDPKIQAALFARGSEQISAVFQSNRQDTKIIPLNFEEALKNKVKITYEADLKTQSNVNIFVRGLGERSEKYTEQLKNEPIAKKCLQDVSQNNFYQKDCYKAIIKAHVPDYFKAVVTYKDVDYASWNWTQYAYNSLKDAYSWEEGTNPLMTVDDGKLEIEAQAYYLDNYFDFKFASKYGTLSVENVEGMWYYPYAMAVYAPITAWERSRNWFTGYQNLPYCAVDNSKVWTFSGRSYNYSLTGSWHVVMLDESIDSGKWTDLVILARRPSANQEEVYVSYKTETGKFIELEIKPNNVEVKTNVKKTSEGVLATYWDEDEDAALLEYYNLAEGIQVFHIRNSRLRLIYDKERLIIFTDDHRTTTRGICGQSSSQTRDDYWTPWGLVDLPEYYGASFSLDDEFSDPKTVELKKQAKLKAYQPVTKYTSILRSDAEWTKALNKSVK